MLGRMNILEAPGAAAEIRHGLLGDVGRVVVQHDADDGILGVVRIKLFELWRSRKLTPDDLISRILRRP